VTAPPSVRRSGILREEGQSLILMILALVVLLGFAGLAIDVGRAYLAQRQLQQAVDAASLAAATYLPDSNTANAKAALYSATGSLNSHPYSMTASAPTVDFRCVDSINHPTDGSTPIPCVVDQTVGSPCSPTAVVDGVTGNGCNAVRVTQKATVSTLFARLVPFGVDHFSVSARSTASARGGTPHPLNIMIVLDVSQSMENTCGDSIMYQDVTVVSPNVSRKIECAKDGIRKLLNQFLPCSFKSAGACDTSEPLDQVGLAIFPALLAPDNFTHDKTTPPTHDNYSLETFNSCSGAQTTTPAWYKPNKSFPNSWYLDNTAPDIGYGTPAVAGHNEVDSVKIVGTNGSFTLGFGGQTATIAFTAGPTAPTSASVQTALTALTTIGAGNVTVGARTGNGTSGTPYTYPVTFVGTLANTDVGNLTATDTALTGPNHSATASTTTQGQAGSSAVPPSYVLAGLSNDFKNSNVSPGLNANSRLVNAVTWASCPGGRVTVGSETLASENATGYPRCASAPCPDNMYYGANTPSMGGAATYYTGAIAAAQAQLANDHRGAQNVIILLSDGDANVDPVGDHQPCYDAVQAAQAAAQAGTWVYSIWYPDGTPRQTDGCAIDTTGTHAYDAMRQIARDSHFPLPTVPDPAKFYCVNSATRPKPVWATCNSASTLQGVFTAIGKSLTTARLIDNNK